jgi:hypothetical protein
MGLDLCDLGDSLSYRRLRVILDRSPHDSAFARSIGGDAAEWSATEYLLAVIGDLLATANWQRSGGGQRPKPIPRPGKQPEETRFGTAMPLDDLKAMLDRPRKEVSD